MEKRKLLIADSMQEFCDALMALLQDEFCVCVSTDGKETLEKLDHFRPDVLVLDVMLPGLDGIGVLTCAKQNGINPKVLVTTLVRSDYIFNKLMQLEVSYVLMKPCDLDNAAERVREIADSCCEISGPAQNREETVAQILLELGVNPKHNGYHYLCSAVDAYAADNTQALTKELYVAVGAMHGVGWQQVERSIRAALESAWRNRDENVWRQWFPTGTYNTLKRPTNGEVICRLVQYVLLKKIRKIG